MQNTPPVAEPPKTDQSRAWFCGFLFVHTAAYLFYVSATHSASFSKLAAFIGIFPVLWGVFRTIACFNRGDRILAFSNLGLTALWVYLQLETNFKYLLL